MMYFAIIMKIICIIFLQYLFSGFFTIIFGVDCVHAEINIYKKISIKEYGGKGDGVADEGEAFLKALYKNKNATLIIPKGEYLIKRDLEIPSGISLNFMPDAKIRVEGNLSIYGMVLTKGGGPHFILKEGYTLRLKHLDSGRQPIFAGQGKVIFIDGGIQKINVDWWQSGTDHTSAFQAAVRAAQESSTKIVSLPSVSTISQTINVPSATIIEGSGWGTIVNFKPSSPAGQPAFHTKNISPPFESSHVVFRDFQLVCHGGEYGFKIGEDSGNGSAWYGEGCQIKNVLIQNHTKAAIWLRRTIRFYAENVKTYNSNGQWGDNITGLLVDQQTDNIDGNNLATFINCDFGKARRYAAYLHNSGRAFTFIGCDFEKTGYEGVYIRKDGEVTNSYLGNINFIGCWFEKHNLAPGRTNGDFASLKIEWSGGLQDFWPIQVIGCTFQGAGKGNKEIIVNNGEIIILGGSVGRVTGKAIDMNEIKGMGNAKIYVK